MFLPNCHPPDILLQFPTIGIFNIGELSAPHSPVHLPCSPPLLLPQTLPAFKGDPPTALVISRSHESSLRDLEFVFTFAATRFPCQPFSLHIPITLFSFQLFPSGDHSCCCQQASDHGQGFSTQHLGGTVLPSLYSNTQNFLFLLTKKAKRLPVALLQSSSPYL